MDSYTVKERGALRGKSNLYNHFHQGEENKDIQMCLWRCIYCNYLEETIKATGHLR